MNSNRGYLRQICNIKEIIDNAKMYYTKISMRVLLFIYCKLILYNFLSKHKV